jgi:hypothetical protein
VLPEQANQYSATLKILYGNRAILVRFELQEQQHKVVKAIYLFFGIKIHG